MLLSIIIYKSSGWGNSMDELKEKALAAIDEKKDLFLDLSDYIWDNPELAYLEFKSAAAQIELLRKLGFEVTEELAGIKTAFKGQYGHGHPVVGILGEFDALSNLSQEAGIAEPKPVVNGGNGHGCGHNTFGASSIAGAYAAMQYLKETGKEGTVIYYGCPAEEGGSGKAFMARDGVFDELDCAIAWHPGNANSVMNVSTLANEQIRYIPETVYFWHNKKDSITRINDGQYAYDQCFCGWTDNMIYAIQNAKKARPFSGAVSQQIVGVLLNLYYYYIETVARKPVFERQNWEYIKKFYHKCYKRIEEDITDEVFSEMFSMASMEKHRSGSLIGIVPHIGIKEFMEKLHSDSYDENAIYQIWDEMAQNEETKHLIENNIKCGVCAEGYTNKPF